MPRATTSVRTAAPAAFLAQLLDTPRISLASGAPVSRNTLASRSYRTAETSDVKRLPAGYRKSVLA